MVKSATIENRKARYNYFIEDTLECGIELRGNEVKSIRAGKASIKEAWTDIINQQMFIKQMHITPWETTNRFDINDKRDVKLLAHKNEINRLHALVKQDGYTLVPLKIYFTDNGKCKVLIGVCKGKKNYDKRATQKERDASREMRRY